MYRYSFEAQLPGTLDVLGPLQLRFGHMTSGGGEQALLKHHGDPTELTFKVLPCVCGVHCLNVWGVHCWHVCGVYCLNVWGVHCWHVCVVCTA